VVLMFPNFCLSHDILTKEIIGRGTERGGLYYVDEVVRKEYAMFAHGTVTRQLWLWHRHLGPPSFGYLKILFPSLFTSNTESIKCETCIRAKNHRVTSLHHVCFGSKPTWCFLCIRVPDAPQRWLSGINRRCGELRHVGSSINV